MSNKPTTLKLKLVLLAIGLVIAAGTFVYTQNLIGDLQESQTEIVELYAQTLDYIANTNVQDAEFTFLLENIVKRIDFPLILTDPYDYVNYAELERNAKNIAIDTTLSITETEEFIARKIEELGSINEPIPVMFQDTILLQKIYYGNSDLLIKLQYYPYFQIFFAAFFILIAYVSFSYLKRVEQSNIWVGMSKETAHQLGTPISSLMGWTELLKINHSEPDKVIDVADEINNDLERLTKIAQRFSKIGSKPELKEQSAYELVCRIVKYFNSRIPQTGKSVELQIEGDSPASIKLNNELFEWVIENLTKNALDAIEHKHGRITFNITDTPKSIDIEVTDNGKGIDRKRRKDVFRPGYSTKRRGWGLGLSLSKRIVEDYHDGKIFVKNSVINEGTTFKISIPKE